MSGGAASSAAPGRYPDAAFFDLDGTLVDREPLAAEAVRRVLRTHADVLTKAGRGGVEATTVGRSWTDVYVVLEIETSLGWTFDRFMAEVLDESDRLRAEGFPTRVLEGGRALVEHLVDNGVAVGLVTGSLRREVPAALDLVGVAELMSVVLAAEDYGTGKPDPACYLAAARALEVEPARCIVFEDSAPGVLAAKRAGMRVIATTDANAPPGDPGHQDLRDADVVVARLSEVQDRHLRMTTG